jgi:hypothetical protein
MAEKSKIIPTKDFFLWEPIKGFNLNFLRELVLNRNKFKSKRGTDSI